MLLLLLSRSVVADSVWPPRRQPPGSPGPGILQARALKWVVIAFSARRDDFLYVTQAGVVGDTMRTKPVIPLPGMARLVYTWCSLSAESGGVE